MLVPAPNHSWILRNERADALAREGPARWYKSPKPFWGIVIATIINKIQELLEIWLLRVVIKPNYPYHYYSLI